MDAEAIRVVLEKEDGEKLSFVTDLVPAREYKRVQAENTKLLEQGERLFDKTLELGTENAKLRELVRALDWHIRTDGLCADCPMGLAPDAPYEVMCDVMIEELGVDV